MSWFTLLFKKGEESSTIPTDVPTVLVIDPSAIVRKTFEEMFREEAYQVSSVSNEADARKQLLEVLPDVAFIDLGLREEGAVNLCRFIKGHPKLKDKAVFVLVPAFMPCDDDLAKRMHANGHFRKPLESIKNVIDAVNAVTTRGEKI